MIMQSVSATRMRPRAFRMLSSAAGAMKPSRRCPIDSWMRSLWWAPPIGIPPRLGAWKEAARNRHVDTIILGGNANADVLRLIADAAG